MAAKFNFFSEKNKSNDVNEATLNEQNITTQRVKSTVPKSDKELSHLIIEELKNQNLGIEYEEFPNHFNFYVYEDEWEMFSKISQECEKKLADIKAEQFRKASEEQEKKQSLDNQTANAQSRIETEKQNRQPQIMTVNFKSEIKVILEELLENENIEYEIEPYGEEWELQFYEKDAEKIQTLANESIAIYASEKTQEALSNIEKEREEKINSSVEEPKYDVIDEPEQQGVGRKRSRQIKIWVDKKEDELIKKNVETSGKSQSDYVREMAMNGVIKVAPSAAGDMYLRKRIETIEGTLGKISGAIVKIMQSTKESNSLTAEERADLQKEIYALRKLKSEIRKEVKEVWH